MPRARSRSPAEGARVYSPEMVPIARGRRVVLRAPRPGDEAEFLALVRRSRRLHHPWVRPPDTPAKFRAWLARAGGDAFRPYLVCARRGGALLGVINLSQIFHGNFRSAYSGYYGDAAAAGRGYVAEGMRLLIRHAFSTLKLHRLEANIQPGNRASIRLAKACGFRLEGYSPRYLKIAGRWRDHERWAITAD